MVEQRFRLKLFGAPEVREVDRGVLQFRTRKQLALLVYLHFEGRGRLVSRDELVELLWPGVTLEKGRHSLSEALSFLRTRLGPGAVVCSVAGIGLAVPLATELEELGVGSDDLTELADPLQGLELCGGPAFAHWVDRVREGILRQAREILVGRVREARATGALDWVYRRAALLHRLDPVEPVAVLALAERALLDGDTIGAMRVMKEYLQEVAKELGANPHPEVATLLRRLERGEGPALVFTRRLGSTPRLPREVFVSREFELSRLEALWQGISQRVCQTCLVTGVAGIGKSALVRRFAMSVAARALPAYVVACQEIGAGIPFAAVADLILAMGHDPLVAGTDPSWLAEASRVSPALKAIYPGIPEPPVAPAESVRIRVADALVAMLESVADGRPVLLVFDDVHHMDPASRDVLFLVTRRLERVRVMILGTLRAGDGSSSGWAVEAGTLAWEQRIELGPLDDASVYRMVDLLGEGEEVDGAVRDKIVKFAQGNPYHAELLFTDWRQRGKESLVLLDENALGRSQWSPPDTFRSAFLAQYHDVSENVRHILHLLAVAARAMSAAEIADVLTLHRGAVEKALLGLIERGLLRVEAGRFQFKNDLHRAFLYYFMELDLRKLHHEMLANGAWSRHRGAEFKYASEACHHFLRAGMLTEATGAAIEACRNALKQGAAREALKIIDRLLQDCPEPQDRWFYLLLSQASLAVGDYRRAQLALERWVAGEDPRGDAFVAQLRAEILHKARQGSDASIATAAAEAVLAAREAEAEDVLVRALMVRAEAAWDRGDVAALQELRDEVERVSQTPTSLETAPLATVTRSYIEWALGNFESASSLLKVALPTLKRLCMQNDYRHALNGLGVCLSSLGRFDEAIQAFQGAIEIANRLGDDIGASLSWSNLGSLYTDLAWFNSAANAFRAAIAIVTPAQVRLGAEVHANAMWLSIHLGNLEEAEQFAEGCEREASRSGLWRHSALACLSRADLLLARCSPELAWPFVERALGLVDNRAHLLFDVGQYHRLVMQWLFSTKGAAALEPWLNPGRVGNYRRVTDWLEIRAAAEWLLATPSSSKDQLAAGALKEIESIGALGVLSRLVAVRCAPIAVAPRLQKESPAQTVARLYPEQMRVHIPNSVLRQPRGAPL